MPQKLKFRIEEYKGNFYPQVEIEFILKKRWFYLSEYSPDFIRYVINRPEITTNNQTIDSAEQIITMFKKQLDTKVKYHNEREETIG